MPPGTILCKSRQYKYVSPSNTSTRRSEDTETHTPTVNMSSNEEFGSDLSFYLNFVIINASEVVSKGIKDKMGNRLLGKAASALASTTIDADAKVTEKVGQQLEEKIPVSSALAKRF